MESEGKKIKFEEDPDGFLRRATPECSPVVVKSLARPATATVYTTRITSKKQRLTDDDNNIDSSNKASLVTSKIADEDDEHSEESEYVYASTIPLSKIDLYSEEREQITSLTILKKKELDIKNLLSEKLCVS